MFLNYVHPARTCPNAYTFAVPSPSWASGSTTWLMLHANCSAPAKTQGSLREDLPMWFWVRGGCNLRHPLWVNIAKGARQLLEWFYWIRMVHHPLLTRPTRWLIINVLELDEFLLSSKDFILNINFWWYKGQYAVHHLEPAMSGNIDPYIDYSII